MKSKIHGLEVDARMVG
jgi:hypothetical protein